MTQKLPKEYSEVIQESLKILYFDNQIRTEQRDMGKKSSLLYFITPYGNDKIMSKLRNIGIPDLRNLPGKKSLWDRWSSEETLSYISNNYPSYIARSSDILLRHIFGSILGLFVRVVIGLGGHLRYYTYYLRYYRLRKKRKMWLREKRKMYIRKSREILDGEKKGRKKR